MSHTFTKNHQHIIFSTAKRRKLIEKEFQPKLWAYMAGICRNHGIFVRTIGGVEDHIHMLIELPPTIAVAEAVREIKSNSSKWVNALGRRFGWQKGYAAFSVSASNIGAVEFLISVAPTALSSSLHVTQRFRAGLPLVRASGAR